MLEEMARVRQLLRSAAIPLSAAALFFAGPARAADELAERHRANVRRQ